MIAYLGLNVLWRLPEPWDWLGFFSVAPLMYVQRRMNLAMDQSGDQSKPETRFSAWEIAISLVLGLVWLLAIIGLFLPNDATNINGLLHLWRLQYMNA